MPPKAGRKRGRESTGTTGKAAAATASSFSAPGSAPPASRRTRSNSVTSQQEDGGGSANDDHRATKRTRRGGGAARRDTDSSEDVDMEDSDEPGANGGGARPAAAGAAAKKGSRRKSTSAVVANGETAAPQPATKRGRKSTSSASAAAPRSSVPERPPPIANGAAAAAAGAGGRPPLPLPAAASRTPAPAPRAAAGRGSSAVAGAAAAGAGGAPSSSEARRQGTSPSGSNATPAANAAAAAAAAERATAQQARARVPATPSGGASSPVPAARLRRVTGPGSPNGDDDSGGGGGGGGGGGEGQAGRENGLGGRRWRTVASRGRDAWTVVCDKCLPEDASAVLPTVQKLTVRCLLLLGFLLGAHAIWVATLWVARGFGTAGGGGGGGGGVASRRQTALSLVRQREDFRSLDAVLAERRRYLKEMEAQDAGEQETLQSLRVFVESLDGQIELLREQAADGVASRGAPENPEASEAAALSQLEEVKAMQEQLVAVRETTSNTVEEGQEWTLSATQDLEALASSSHLGQLSQEERAGLEAAAEEEWAAVFAAPLEEAFLDLEKAHMAVQRIAATGEARPGAEEAAELVRLVEEAKRDAAAGVDGRSGLLERIKEIAEREVALKWGEGGNTDSSGSGPELPQTLRTAEEAEELVAREVEIFSSGGTGMPDHASLTQGSSVVYSSKAAAAAESEAPLTSPTLASTKLPWASYMLHMLRVPGRVFAEKADAALSSPNSLGSCFAFEGGEGRLTVKLAPAPASSVAAPPSSSSASSSSDSAAGEGGGGGATARTRGFVKVTHVSIEHARTALAPTVARSAPRAFRVLGWDSDPAGAAAAAAAAGEGSLGGGDGGGGRPALRPYILLEGAEYLAGGGALGVQTFEVSEAGRELAPPVGWVTLEVQSNHGGPWTCLYGFRVHGDPAF